MTISLILCNFIRLAFVALFCTVQFSQVIICVSNGCIFCTMYVTTYTSAIHYHTFFAGRPKSVLYNSLVVLYCTVVILHCTTAITKKSPKGAITNQWCTAYNINQQIITVLTIHALYGTVLVGRTPRAATTNPCCTTRCRRRRTRRQPTGSSSPTTRLNPRKPATSVSTATFCLGSVRVSRTFPDFIRIFLNFLFLTSRGGGEGL